MAVKERFYTVADLRRMPDDGKRRELVNGELIEMNPPAHKHALLSSRIFTRLSVYVEQHDLGFVTGSDGGYLLYTDPETGRETVRVPDVSFISTARRATRLDDLYGGAPDLAVEVISPGETYISIREKLAEYFAYGTRMVWLVYSDYPSVEVFTSANDGIALGLDKTLMGGDLLPGFELPIHDIFAILGS